jgi:signal transduction histidine kinase
MRVTVAVRDNGPGVAQQQQAMIFEKFRQGGEATNRPQGTGPGLADQSTDRGALWWALWLESSPPDGACFCFLPLTVLPALKIAGDKDLA